MEGKKLVYLTKAGRLSKLRVPNLNFTGQRTAREKKNRNEVYDGERVLPDKMEGIETQLDEINQQRAELENMKKFLEQQQLEIQKAREELSARQQQQKPSQQQFEALRRQLEVQSSELLQLRNVQLSASNGAGQPTQTPIVNNVRKNYITDFSDTKCVFTRQG